jgi:hypothetical protein
VLGSGRRRGKLIVDADVLLGLLVSPIGAGHLTDTPFALQRPAVKIRTSGMLASTLQGPAPRSPAMPDTAPSLSGDIVITPPPFGFSGAAPSEPPPALLAHDAASPIAPSGGVWAVVIGINVYAGGYDLKSSVNDANDMTTALEDEGVSPDHILEVTDGQATASVILATADWLVAHAAPDATAVFFYAGHVQKLSSDREAIVASDGNLVTDGDLASRFSRLQAQRAWFVMATCYGGGFDELLGPGRVLTAAADANHLAYENESFRRSYLGEFMIRKAIIEEQAPSSVQAAFSYAWNQIHGSYPGREPFEYDDLGAPLALSQGKAPPPPPRSTSPPADQPQPQPAPSSPPPAPPPTTTTTTTPDENGCGSLTFGLVECSH